MYDIDKITQLLGGAAILGKEVRTPLELSTLLRHGLPTAVLTSLTRHLAPDAPLVDFVLTPRGGPASVTSSSSARGRISTEQSSRIYRVAAALAHAIDTLGSATAAKAWLTSKQDIFDGAAPLQLLETDVGHEIVQTALGQLDHGIAG